jgi:hypothetical protein
MILLEIVAQRMPGYRVKLVLPELQKAASMRQPRNYNVLISFIFLFPSN